MHRSSPQSILGQRRRRRFHRKAIWLCHEICLPTLTKFDIENVSVERFVAKLTILVSFFFFFFMFSASNRNDLASSTSRSRFQRYGRRKKKKKKAWLHVVSSLITLLQLVVWLLTPEYAVICGGSALLMCKLKSSCLYLQASRGQLAEMGADKRWVTFHDGAKFSIKMRQQWGLSAQSLICRLFAYVREYQKYISSFWSHRHMLPITTPPPHSENADKRPNIAQAAALTKTSWRKCVFCPLGRISRTERSGRYGSDQSRDDSDWRDRRERDQERDNMRRWGDERRNDRFDDRRGSRDSPEVGSPHPCTTPDRVKMKYRSK